MDEDRGFTIVAAETDSDFRLDTLIARTLPNCSRKLASSLIRNGLIRVSGSMKKPGYRTRPGDVIEGNIPEPVETGFTPESIPLNILFEDHDLIVLNKDPGIVVHPAPGNPSGTLVNGLLHHAPDLEGIGGGIRPGIVHRLDKDTSGVLLVAKNHAAHTDLSRQFKTRSVQKTYLALVYGDVESTTGIIDFPIGRHPIHRKQMSVHSRKPRQAETRWKVRERLRDACLLELDLRTGRTHQIRVHCHAIHHPVIGDPVYGARSTPRRIKQMGRCGHLIQKVDRQMLHSWRLRVSHPQTRDTMTFEAPLPEDMERLLADLRQTESRA